MKTIMKPFKHPSHLISILLLFPFSYSSRYEFSLNPKRLKLLEDALSWLTLRSNGKLLEPDINAKLVRSLHEEYNNSLYFRTINIAFQLGVLPKLTLQQGQQCDPAYTLRYRSELNNSVTRYKVKNFTLESYYDLKKSGLQSGPYCDYGKGLVCLPTTKKCDCPEGSKMGPIEANSQEQRCLIDEDEVCPIADLVTYRNISTLMRKLPELVFNLEKPQSCKHGTTCRVKDSPFPRCLSITKAPFRNNGPARKYGEECVLDYFGEGGGCDVSASSHRAGVCFNFWGYLPNKRLPTTGVHKRKGMCALDITPFMTPGVRSWGQAQGSPTIELYYPFLTAFINPRTVKMSSSQLLDYDSKLHIITSDYNKEDASYYPGMPSRHKRIQRDVGGPCSMTDTAKLIEIWNFYASLEKNPPPGQDFVADVPTLQAKLVEYKSLIDNHTDYEPRICRIYSEDSWLGKTPPLACVSTGGTPDAKGNDGTCQISKNNDTYALTLNILNFRNDDYRSKDEIQNKDKFHDPVILWHNPEAQCEQSQISQRIQEGGICTEAYACVEDFNEIHGIYKSRGCSLVADYQPRFTCVDVLSESDDVKENTCEEELINQRVLNAVKMAPRLEMGSTCNYQLEKEVETLYSNSERYKTNRYRLLLSLKTNGICDQTKLLECTEQNICGCGEYGVPRESADKKYTSDYCYMIAGRCSRTVSEQLTRYPLTKAEKAEMDSHYGTRATIHYQFCDDGNLCKFIDSCRSECTDVITGSTGFDVDIVGGCLPITATSTTSPETEHIERNEPSTKPLQPEVPFNGGKKNLSLKKQSHLIRVVISVIIILNSFNLTFEPSC